MTKIFYNTLKKDHMEEAVIKLRNGEIGCDEASRTYGIPKPTLRRHSNKI